jgi:uncharacterized protein YegL
MGLRNAQLKGFIGLNKFGRNKIILFTMGIMILIFISSFTIAILKNARANDNKNNVIIEYLSINTVIDNNYAITEINELIRNPYNNSINQIFSFEIPKKAFISNFSLNIDNKMYYAQILPKDIGKQKFENATKIGSDAGLVEAKGNNLFSYSVSLSPNQKILVGLKYEQFLEKSLGGYEYILPLNIENSKSKINSFSIDITVNAQLFITKLEVQNYRDEANINFVSANKVKISYQKSSFTQTENFIVNYELAAPPINGTLLNYNDKTDEYFFHIFSPQKTHLGGQSMDKEIIFVLDKSGSMKGEKIGQLKTAFEEIINQLPAQDSFNIVMFDNSIKQYTDELQEANDDNKAEAVKYIQSFSAGGSTNINEALTTALDMFQASETKVPIIVMLTDGLPTEGVTNPSAIRDNVKNTNQAEVAIFCLGFGYDVDFEFLKALSLENYGIAIRIYEGGDASEQITNFYDTISTPLLKGVTFTYSNGAYEIYPTKVDQLFEGAEVVVVGKYKGISRKITSTVDATSWDGMKTFKETFELEDSTSNTFIPRFWAYAKIRYLLDEITVGQSTDSLIEIVTNLSLEYNFVTPYTSLFIEVIQAKPGINLDEFDISYDPVDDDWDDKKSKSKKSGSGRGGGLPSFEIGSVLISFSIIIMYLSRKKRK